MNLNRAPWLPSVLRNAGLEVVEISGWRGRGRDMSTIYGIVVHDTVTTKAWPDSRVDRLLRDGRPRVPGPLAQLGLDRQGRFRMIADGRANHNGHGTWGNNSIGIEVYAAGGLSGHEERWNSTQEEVVVIATRAILDYMDLPRSSLWNPRVAGHKETDPRRKIDPWRVSVSQLRRKVSQQSTPTPDERSWFDMATEADLRKVVKEVIDSERSAIAKEAVDMLLSWRRSDDHRPLASWFYSGGVRLDELEKPHPNDLPVMVARIEDMLRDKGVEIQDVDEDSTVVIATNDVDEGVARLFAAIIGAKFHRHENEPLDPKVERGILIGAAGNLAAEVVGAESVIRIQGANRQETVAGAKAALDEVKK